MAKKQVMPPVSLPAREGDVDLPNDLLAKITFFTQLKSVPTLDKYPGALRLRFYQEGEAICDYGEPGWSAFYLLTADDVRRLNEDPRLASRPLAQPEPPAWDTARARAAWHRAAAAQTGDEDQARLVAETTTADPGRQREIADLLDAEAPALASSLRELARSADGVARCAFALFPRTEPQGARGTASFLSRWFGRKEAKRSAFPAFIPVDAPRDVSSRSRIASMYEGELFGEVSCLFRSPRSATILAARPIYVLELLRSILDQVQKDAGYRQRLEATARARLAHSSLRQFSLFSALSDANLNWLAAQVQLEEFEAGSLIFDEGDAADGMYVIGGGIVKVLTNASWLLPPHAPLDGTALASSLRAGAQAEAGPERRLWERLPATWHVELCALANGSSLAPARVAALVHALNDLIRDPLLHQDAEFRPIVDQNQLGLRVWKHLAGAHRDTAPDLWRCNRVLLEGLYLSAFPTWNPAAEASTCLLRPTEVANWRNLCARLAGDDKKASRAEIWIANRLAEPAREAVRRGKAADLTDADKEAVSAAVNDVLCSVPLLLVSEFSQLVLDKPTLAGKIMEFLPRGPGAAGGAPRRWTAFDFERGNRALNRLLLETLCPPLKQLSRPDGPMTILAYRGRDESLGEMGLVEGRPRSATCVAYSHPDNDPDRETGPAQLFRITHQVLEELKRRDPGLEKRLQQIIAARRAEVIPSSHGEHPQIGRGLLASPRGDELGVIQGQQLMLIDLDRCTRCDECVKACVATHDDGRSRLFLNGPRLDRYLVPTTCRSCLDPVCMIGCPVGSIHRGRNRQIIIEDWCIGCGKCADQCPYGAIQMHSLSIVAAGSGGWRYMAAVSADKKNWGAVRHDDRRWIEGRAPFRRDRSLMDTLEAISGATRESADQSICFRRRFEWTRPQLRQHAEFKLAVRTFDPDPHLFLNGSTLEPDEKPRQKKDAATGRLRPLEFEYTVLRDSKIIVAGANVLAARVNLQPVPPGDLVFDAQLDALRQSEHAEVEIKPVDQLAVVCDLCSTLSTGPACVTACPHEAAARVNAREHIQPG